MGSAFCLMRAVRDIAASVMRRDEFQGDVLYAIYRAADGRWLVYARGQISDLTAPDCPEPSTVLARQRHH